MEPTIPPITDYPHGLRHAHHSFLPSLGDFTQSLTLSDYKLWDLHEDVQRSKLFGFTVRELQACGAWHKADAKANNLEQTIPIHALLVRSQWLTSKQPMGNGNLGKWCPVTNDRLWNALVPILRLAGLFLARTESVWQDAMWEGDWFPVPCEDGCPEFSTLRQAYSFWTRKPHERQSGTDRASQWRLDLVKRVKFCFEDRPGEANLPYGYLVPQVVPHIDSHGNLRMRFEGKIVLCTDYMVSLMTEALSTSERLAQNHLVAKTIAHEVMHASMHIARELRPMPSSGCEPFFENEAIAEAGFSWENTAFGGLAGHIHNTPDTKTYKPILAEFIAPWPNFFIYGNGQYNPVTAERYRYKEQFHNPTARYEQWPVSITHIETLQQADFWSAHPIPEEAFKGPLILGKCLLNEGPFTHPSIFFERQFTILGKDYYRWALGPAGLVQPLPDKPVHAGDLMKYGYELALATRAATINVSMMRKNNNTFNTRNLTALAQDTTLTPEDIVEIERISGKQKLLESRLLKDEERRLELAKQYYNPANEQPSREIYESLIRSDNRFVCACAAFALAQMQTVPYLEQIKICQKAIDEFTVLNVESPSWYKYLKLAQERMKILLIQKYMQQPQS